MSASPAADKPAPYRDHVRETAETLVFVVVLVLILQLFVLEAFVIPTGSMAETQFGYHKDVTCEKCKFEFPVNASDEADGIDVVGTYTCPNCQFHHPTKYAADGKKVPLPFPLANGDRVLVHKMMSADERGRVMVFKYPVAPQKKQQAQNYIKRCMGFGGETVALACGDLYTTRGLTYPTGDRPDDPRDLWLHKYTYHRDPAATALFDAGKSLGFPAGVGGFELYRKPDELALEMRRIVYDNDRQPDDLGGRVPPRWAVREGAGWSADSAAAPKAFTHAGDGLGWIGYRHLSGVRSSDTFPDLWDGNARPQLITNVLGYNCNKDNKDEPLPDDKDMAALEVKATAIEKLQDDLRSRLQSLRNRGQRDYAEETKLEAQLADQGTRAAKIEEYRKRRTAVQWVGDLTLECTAQVEAGGAVVLELSKGKHRYQAEFADGTVRLVRTGPGNWTPVSRPTPMTKAGTYRLRFANVDCRLRVWVNDTAIDFGADADYPPTADGFRWHDANDREAPAGIGAKGAVTVSGLKLWRDGYYTPDQSSYGGRDTVETYYVHPGHYLCLGDNSAQSSDGRSWGVVPERLMIGRAVFTFWPGYPSWRIGAIR